MPSPKSIHQYLERYAEPQLSTIATLIADLSVVLQHAMVIPCFDEGTDFIQRLSALESSDDWLFVVVLNAPSQATPSQIQNTLACQSLLEQTATKAAANKPLGVTLFQQETKFFLCLNLITTQNLRWRQSGVGYARKIGMDLCLQLFDQGRLLNPVVRNSDADVFWPRDYLQYHLNPLPTISAYLYPFYHCWDTLEDLNHQRQAQRYDQWLRYYVAGLTWANSPWAFHTIGSTLAVHLLHYAINRGFPKKEAGEDFYLLNKLAKSGAIISLTKPALGLSARCSTRTPYGTGATLNKLTTSPDEQQRFYHPAIFEQLKYWHQVIQGQDVFSELDFPAPYKAMENALRAFKIEPLLQHCMSHSKTSAGFRRHLLNGFDANLTRRCVHWLRNHYFPSLTYELLCEEVQSGKVPFLKTMDALTPYP